jgi:hypothetical protein
MNAESKKNVGTIEGVALILSILACLTLFLKIMPNINNNAEFYNEQFLSMQKQLDGLQIHVDNLERYSLRSQYNPEIRDLQRIVSELEMSGRDMPKEFQSRIADLQKAVTNLVEELKKTQP